MEFSGPLGDVTVLLVNSDSSQCNAARWQLAGAGLSAMCVENGFMALERMRDRAPDVVVIESQTPALTGVAFGQLMRQHPHLRHVPIIFVSDDIAYDLAVMSTANLGAIDLLPKPLDVNQLVVRVQRLVNMKAAMTVTRVTTNTPQRLVSPFLPFAAGS